MDTDEYKSPILTIEKSYSSEFHPLKMDRLNGIMNKDLSEVLGCEFDLKINKCSELIR